jgi:hypothetical protein
MTDDTALSLALRKKFKTREEVFARLGLNPVTFDEESSNMSTRFTRPRRFGYDQENDEGTAQLRQMLDDDELDVADLIACAVEYAPEHKREGLHQALHELGEDRRGPRSWARDRLERRKLSKDMRERRARDRRLGKDDPEPFVGRPRPGGGMDPVRPDFEGLDDRGYPIENFGRSDADRQIREAGGTDRRMGRDMAMDRGRGGSAVLRFITGG